MDAWEGIARDVTERHRVETCPAAVYEATAMLSEASAIEEAAPRLMEVLGTSLEGSAGALWLPPAESGRAPLVRQPVERIQGRCGVEASPGAGRRFWIELPAAGRPGYIGGGAAGVSAGGTCSCSQRRASVSPTSNWKVAWLIS